MSNIATSYRTFSELVDLMTEERRVGGSAMIKRENFTDFGPISENIEFVKDRYMGFAAFGYIERLIRKLAVEYGQARYSLLKITSYREACGFFSGALVVYLDATDRQSYDEIAFSWAGKGEIEDTWDNFTKWEVTKKTGV